MTWHLFGVVMLCCIGATTGYWLAAGLRGRASRTLTKRALLVEGICWALVGLADVMQLDATWAAVDLAMAAVTFWLWWRRGGREDWREQLEAAKRS